MGNDRIFYTDESLHLKRKGNGVWMPEKGKSVWDSLRLDLVDKGLIGEGPYSQVRRLQFNLKTVIFHEFDFETSDLEFEVSK